MSYEQFNNPPQRPPLDPYQLTASNTPRSWARATQIGLVLLGLAVCVRVGGLWNWGRQAVLASQPPAAEKSAAKSVVEPVAEHAAEMPSEPSPIESTQVQARPARLRRAVEPTPDTASNRAMLTALQSQADAWQAAASSWEQTIADLLENEQGRQLAADEMRLRQFRAVREQGLPPDLRLQALRQQIATLEGMLSAADFSSVTPEAFESDLASMNTEATAAVDAYRVAMRQLQVVLGALTAPAGTMTLREALLELERKEDLASIEALEQRLAAAKQAADEKVAAAQEAAVRALGEMEARQIVAATEAAREKQALTEAAEQAAAEIAKRQAAMKRDLPEIKSYLKPFITNGHAQPHGWHNIATGESSPMSWAKLASSGALEPTQEGMQQLWRYAAVENDRGRGRFPEYNGAQWAWNKDVAEFLGRAQTLLKTHGDALVAEGLLAP